MEIYFICHSYYWTVLSKILCNSLLWIYIYTYIGKHQWSRSIYQAKLYLMSDIFFFYNMQFFKISPLSIVNLGTSWNRRNNTEKVLQLKKSPISYNYKRKITILQEKYYIYTSPILKRSPTEKSYKCLIGEILFYRRSTIYTEVLQKVLRCKKDKILNRKRPPSQAINLNDLQIHLKKFISKSASFFLPTKGNVINEHKKKYLLSWLKKLYRDKIRLKNISNCIYYGSYCNNTWIIYLF